MAPTSPLRSHAGAAILALVTLSNCDGYVPSVTGFVTEVEPSFDRLAADLRKLTRGRRQTPSEVLQREGRTER
jgi:hypothetical protein